MQKVTLSGMLHISVDKYLLQAVQDWIYRDSHLCMLKDLSILHWLIPGIMHPVFILQDVLQRRWTVEFLVVIVQ